MLSITVKLPNGSKKPLNVNRSETVRKVVEMCMGDQATKWILDCPRPWRQPPKTKTLEAAGVPNGAMCNLKAMPKSKNTGAKEKRNAAAASGAECAAKRQKKEPEAVSGADAPSPAAVAMPVASEPVPADLYAMIVEQGIHHIPDSPWVS